MLYSCFSPAPGMQAFTLLSHRIPAEVKSYSCTVQQKLSIAFLRLRACSYCCSSVVLQAMRENVLSSHVWCGCEVVLSPDTMAAIPHGKGLVTIERFLGCAKSAILIFE